MFSVILGFALLMLAGHILSCAIVGTLMIIDRIKGRPKS